jgi:DeoR/GlpR family transcriptional regulator of sugar metabolism
MGRNSFALFAALDTIDAIVTDSLKEGEGQRLEERGIDVIVAREL